MYIDEMYIGFLVILDMVMEVCIIEECKNVCIVDVVVVLDGKVVILVKGMQVFVISDVEGDGG